MISLILRLQAKPVICFIHGLNMAELYVVRTAEAWREANCGLAACVGLVLAVSYLL